MPSNRMYIYRKEESENLRAFIGLTNLDARLECQMLLAMMFLHFAVSYNKMFKGDGKMMPRDAS